MNFIQDKFKYGWYCGIEGSNFFTGFNIDLANWALPFGFAMHDEHDVCINFMFLCFALYHNHYSDK